MTATAVPNALRELRSWLTWRYEQREGDKKPRKIPMYAATGRIRCGTQGSPDDRAGLVGYDEAVSAAIHSQHGIGLAMLPDHNLVALDFDNCVDEAGAVNEDVLHLTSGTYSELSPSRHGVRAFFSGQLNDGKAATTDTQFGFEVFFAKGFVTVTGLMLPGALGVISPLPDHVRKYAALRLDRSPAPIQPGVSDGTPDWVRAARKHEYAQCDTWFEPMRADQKEAEVRAIAATWTTEQATNRDEWFKCIRSLADAIGRGLDSEIALDIAEEFSQRTMANNLADRHTIALKMSERGEKPSIYSVAAVARHAGYIAPPDRIPPPPPSHPSATANTNIAIGSFAANLDLRVTRNGIIADEENVLRILKRDPHLQGIVRYDEFSGDMILARPITSDSFIIGERGIPRQWTDADTVTLQTYIQRHIVPRIGRDKIEAVIAKHARHDCAFHPVRDYLQSLSWDGTSRLNTWLRDYLGADSQPEIYLAAVGAAWLISAVARIMQPGCQADSALVLEGVQGIRKSTALRILAGDEYFSDSLPADLAHKDARDHLRGKWIIELAELAQFRRAEIETVKAFISRRYEQYRPSYGRHEVKFPRQCVFAGSTNDDTYLVDTTGNRRFWSVACSAVAIEALRRDRDQLWAEAVARYNRGELWHLTGELEDMAASEARARVAHDPWTAKVSDIVMTTIPAADVSPGEIMAHMSLHESERHQRNAARVGQILRDLHWTKGRRDRTRGQLYMRPAGMCMFGRSPLPPGAIPIVKP